MDEQHRNEIARVLRRYYKAAEVCSALGNAEDAADWRDADHIDRLINIRGGYL